LLLLLLPALYVGFWLLLQILVIVADDLGFNDVGFQTPSYAITHTPNLDELAKNGVVFTNHHVQPFCSPTRSGYVSLFLGLDSACYVLSPCSAEQGMYPNGSACPALWAPEHGDLAAGPLGVAPQRDLPL
jgi:hypothetical protein